MKRFLALTVLTALLTVFSACKKEEPPTAPVLPTEPVTETSAPEPEPVDLSHVDKRYYMGYLVHEDHYDKDGIFVRSMEYSNGRKSECTDYSAEGEALSTEYYDEYGRTTGTAVYEYKDGMQIRVTYFDQDGIALRAKETAYDESGRDVKLTELDAEGQISSYTEYEYDTTGRELNRILYNAEGAVQSRARTEYSETGFTVTFYNERGYVSSWRVCETDGQGELISELVYNAYGGIEERRAFEYHANGGVKLHRECYPDGIAKQEYVYDEAGNLVKYTEYESNRSFRSGVAYEYTEDGILLKRMDYWYSRERYRCVTEYDEAGRVTFITYYSADGELSNKSEYQYDEKGREVLYVNYNTDGSIAFKRVKEYDEKGVLVSSIKYDAAGNVIE